MVRSFEDGGEVERTTKRIPTECFPLDPFPAAYLARVFDWKPGIEKVLEVFPGKSQYRLRLYCEKLVTLVLGRVQRQAWVIVPTAINLDPEKQAEAAGKPQARMKIYLAADEGKDVLKIEASHSMGYLMVVLDSFEREGPLAAAPLNPAATMK